MEEDFHIIAEKISEAVNFAKKKNFARFQGEQNNFSQNVANVKL